MTTNENTTTTIVVSEPLDPTPEQLLVLKRYANASRASYNFAFGLMDLAQRRWDRGRDQLLLEGMSRKEANRKAPKTFVPRASDVQRIFRAVREEPMLGPLREGESEYRRMYRWWAGVNAIVCQQAFRDAETAFANWRSSSRRAGDAVGYPRLKRVGRCRDSFRMTSVRLVASDLRHVRIGGEKDPAGQRALIVRLHRPARPLARAIARGGVVKMVTVKREGSQWWASFNVRIDAPPPVQPSRRQKEGGTVGVDLGVAVFAATSEPVLTAAGKVQLFENPRHLDNARRQLRKWERRMARRYVKGLPARRQSAGWREARDQVAHLKGLVAQRRASAQHLLTKQLVTQFAHVALEDLRVKNMTRTARGSVEKPGRNVAAKAGLNRAILDVGFGEIRRQIEYKAKWHGVRVTAVNPAYTSQTCHRCGHVDRKSRRTRSLFQCTRCGHVTHADIGAAHNIKHRAIELDSTVEPR